MAEAEKRDTDRIPYKIPVKCLPVGSDFPTYESVEIWTNDVHPNGTGLDWLITSKPQTCPVCESVVKDLNCLKPQCPYRALRDVLMDCGWLQIQGLDNVPGWENEKKILGKVIWFKMDDHGINFHFGVQFSRERPPIKLESPIEYGSESGLLTIPSEPEIPEIAEIKEPQGHSVHELDIERWNAALKVGRKQALVVEEDSYESREISEFLQGIGYAGKSVSSGLISMMDHFVENPKLVMFNPISRGALKMEIVENIKRAHPDIKLALLVEPEYKMDILDHANFRLADFIFIKPLDYDRIKDALSTM